MASTLYELGLAQLVPKFKTKCPFCGQTSSVGCLGGGSTRRFYCCDCGVEFSTKEDKICDACKISTGGTVEPVE